MPSKIKNSRAYKWEGEGREKHERDCGEKKFRSTIGEKKPCVWLTVLDRMRQREMMSNLSSTLARLSALLLGNTNVKCEELVPCVSPASEQHRLVSGYEKNQSVNMPLFFSTSKERSQKPIRSRLPFVIKCSQELRLWELHFLEGQ